MSVTTAFFIFAFISISFSCTLNSYCSSEQCDSCVSNGGKWCSSYQGQPTCVSRYLKCSNTSYVATSSSQCPKPVLPTNNDCKPGYECTDCNTCIKNGGHFCQQLKGIQWCVPTYFHCDANSPAKITTASSCPSANGGSGSSSSGSSASQCYPGGSCADCSLCIGNGGMWCESSNWCADKHKGCPSDNGIAIKDKLNCPSSIKFDCIDSVTGKITKNGRSAPSSDGCNTCTCNDGEMLCTMMACIPADGGYLSSSYPSWIYAVIIVPIALCIILGVLIGVVLYLKRKQNANNVVFDEMEMPDSPVTYEPSPTATSGGYTVLQPIYMTVNQ